VADSQVNNYLDSHGHFDPQKALRIPSVIPNAASCVAILISVATPLYGYVHDVQDRPFAGAFVVGIPNGVWRKEEDRGLTPPDRYITAVSDDAGFFELRALPSVEYKLYAFESLDPNDIYDPEFAERFRNREIFTYRLYENRNGTWVSRKIANYAVAFQNQWCAENSLIVRERCYLTVIPAEAVDR
jgi:hypothetical protein